MSKLTAEILKADIEELEAELANDPRHRRLAKLRDLLEEYELPLATVPLKGTVGVTPTAAEVSHKANPLTKEARIRKELANLMRSKGAPVTRNEALEHLKHKKLLGTEKRPMKRLGIYLSFAKRDGIFDNDGSGRWYLKTV
jgi:hypothetical protein